MLGPLELDRLMQAFGRVMESCQSWWVEGLLEVVGPALLLGPDIGVSTSMLLKDSKVGAGLDCRVLARRSARGTLRCSKVIGIDTQDNNDFRKILSFLRRMQTYNFLLTEDTDRGCLWWLLGCAIGVDGNASASGLGLFVFAVDAVLFGDRHFEFGVGWLETTLKTRKRGKERDKRLFLLGKTLFFLILSPFAFHQQHDHHDAPNSLKPAPACRIAQKPHESCAS
jgi:hypothetical protein